MRGRRRRWGGACDRRWLKLGLKNEDSFVLVRELSLGLVCFEGGVSRCWEFTKMVQGSFEILDYFIGSKKG